MLCPECRVAAPGGSSCPRCRRQVPELESFGGQGGHYLRVLAFFSALFLAGFILLTSHGRGVISSLQRVYRSGWVWLYGAIFLLPLGVGAYYWLMLREEELTVTDEHIIRHSRWGDVHLAWRDVRAFRCVPVLFRHTRLGRIAGLSRILVGRRIFVNMPPLRYELIGPPDAAGNPVCLSLEPGTIEDLPWLLQLVEERVGPASVC